MAEPSKHPPAFHIGQVGNLNAGDITIHGDQVGTQLHHFQNSGLKIVIFKGEKCWVSLNLSGRIPIAL